MRFIKGLPKQVYILMDHRTGEVYIFTSVSSRSNYAVSLYNQQIDREIHLTVGTYVPKHKLTK